jgi:hypothetical protein
VERLLNNFQQLLSHGSTFISSDGSLSGGLGNGLGAGIAEAEENVFGSLRLIFGEQSDGILESHDTEIFGLAGALGTIKEGRKVDELASGIHEAEVNEVDVCG